MIFKAMFILFHVMANITLISQAHGANDCVMCLSGIVGSITYGMQTTEIQETKHHDHLM